VDARGCICWPDDWSTRMTVERVGVQWLRPHGIRVLASVRSFAPWHLVATGSGISGQQLRLDRYRQAQ